MGGKVLMVFISYELKMDASDDLRIYRFTVTFADQDVDRTTCDEKAIRLKGN